MYQSGHPLPGTRSGHVCVCVCVCVCVVTVLEDVSRPNTVCPDLPQTLAVS